MKKYRYSATSNTIWTSFDFGEVEANNQQEAKTKAIEKLKYDLAKVNEVLNSADVTCNFSIGIDFENVEVELIGS